VRFGKFDSGKGGWSLYLKRLGTTDISETGLEVRHLDLNHGCFSQVEDL